MRRARRSISVVSIFKFRVSSLRFGFRFDVRGLRLGSGFNSFKSAIGVQIRLFKSELNDNSKLILSSHFKKLDCAQFPAVAHARKD
jgi:hypothetical protein